MDSKNSKQIKIKIRHLNANDKSIVANKASNDNFVVFENVPTDPVLVDASHDLCDGVDTQLKIATIIDTNESSNISDTLIDQNTFVDQTLSTPFGLSNPFAIGRSDPCVYPKRHDLAIFDKALALVYSDKPVTETLKVRRSSGSGFLGNETDDRLKATSYDARKELLLNGQACDFRNLQIPVDWNTSDFSCHYDVSQKLAKAFYRLESKTTCKKAALSGANTFEITELIANEYELSKSALGKEAYWYKNTNGFWPLRVRAIYAHPIDNYLCGIINNTFSWAPISGITSPIVTLPNCDELNLRFNMTSNDPYILYDFSRFGPSMSEALLIRASFYLADIAANYYKLDKLWTQTLLLSNLFPANLILPTEIGSKVLINNPLAGCLDGLSRTSTFNTLFNVYYVLMALNDISYDITTIKSLDDLNNNDFTMIIVGDGGYFRSATLCESFKSALSTIAVDATLGSKLDTDKVIFCGLRIFPNVGFGFNEWSVTKLLRPERSADNRKFRKNPLLGIKASLNYFESIKQDRRLLSSNTVSAILSCLNDFYDLNFTDIDPEDTVDDVQEYALQQEGFYTPDHATFYYKFDLATANTILAINQARTRKQIDPQFVNHFLKGLS